MVKNFTTIDDLMKNKNVVSSTNKEVAPSKSTKSEYSEIEEVIEHKADQDVERFTNPKAETIELPPDIKKLGTQSTGSTQYSAYQNIKLPISDDKVITGLHAPITSSLRWLATFAMYLLACAHVGLKKVHGKVIRFIKT
jgi:hypothetical protein